MPAPLVVAGGIGGKALLMWLLKLLGYSAASAGIMYGIEKLSGSSRKQMEFERETQKERAEIGLLGGREERAAMPMLLEQMRGRNLQLRQSQMQSERDLLRAQGDEAIRAQTMQSLLDPGFSGADFLGKAALQNIASNPMQPPSAHMPISAFLYR